MPPLTIALGNYGLTKPIKQAGVDFGRLDLTFVPVEQIVPMMRRMCRGLEFDICEMAFTTYVCARAAGLPFTAIPLFVTRNFHHWAIFHNVRAGIQTPKDLEGRKIGVNRGYTVTTGLWARGVLQTEYGVDLDKITWIPTDDEHVLGFKAPKNVDYSFRGKPMHDLLLSGEVDAALVALKDALKDGSGASPEDITTKAATLSEESQKLGTAMYAAAAAADSAESAAGDGSDPGQASAGSPGAADDDVVDAEVVDDTEGASAADGSTAAGDKK